MSSPFVAEIRIFPFNFPPEDGRFVMGSSCRSVRIQPFSLCSARRMEETAKAILASRTSKAPRPCIRAKAAG